jgi:uncharacterized protein (TIGR02611 family)
VSRGADRTPRQDAREARRQRRRERPKPKIVERLEERRETYQQRGRVYRTMWVTAGSIVTLAGVAMLLLPGPAFVVIPVGLAMLSLQFAWAASLLERALEHAESARERASATSTRQRVATAAAVLCALGAAVAVVMLYDIDVPLIPFL